MSETFTSIDFTSIHYPFAIDAGLGGLAEESDYAEHVEQMIMQVLFTNPGERVNRPDFGCGLRRMVFAPNSDVAASLAQVTVFQALDTWLGTLINVADVKVQALEEVLEIRIAYILIARQERRYLNLEVTL
jgi:phage baseplate assembly protein W